MYSYVKGSNCNYINWLIRGKNVPFTPLSLKYIYILELSLLDIVLANTISVSMPFLKLYFFRKKCAYNYKAGGCFWLAWTFLRLALCAMCMLFVCCDNCVLYLSTITINIANIQYNKTVSCFADYRISAWYFRYTAGARINIFVFDIFNCWNSQNNGDLKYLKFS